MGNDTRRKKSPSSRTINARSLANLRPATKGEVRNPRGRAPGTKNKSTLAAEALLNEKVKVHEMPLDFLLLSMSDPAHTIGFRFKCAVELMPYCHRRQPVAIDGGEGKPLIPASINPLDLLALTDEQLDKLLTRMDKLGA